MDMPQPNLLISFRNEKYNVRTPCFTDSPASGGSIFRCMAVIVRRRNGRLFFRRSTFSAYAFIRAWMKKNRVFRFVAKAV